MKASQEKALQEQSEARKEKARLAKEKKLQLLSSRWLEGSDALRCQRTVNVSIDPASGRVFPGRLWALS